MTAKSNPHSQRKPLAERLKAGLTAAVQSAKGQLTLRTVHVPDPMAMRVIPKEYD